MLVSQHSKRGEVNPVLLSLDCSILLKLPLIHQAVVLVRFSTATTEDTQRWVMK
ncbi:hypothetical protein GBAR_LOCUS27604 [Geodia barretti]|uniref:Uncharacterized protein n=1 Tax=Geodia barretti TaxID=519541 RepID=A0AA35TKZ6_GEOBA|nr:hypothetical protein GBAR_LOCUS27604 [Geodia barretti]